MWYTGDGSGLRSVPVTWGPKRPFLNFRQQPLLLVAQKTPAGEGQNAFAMAQTQASAQKGAASASSECTDEHRCSSTLAALSNFLLACALCPLHAFTPILLTTMIATKHTGLPARCPAGESFQATQATASERAVADVTVTSNVTLREDGRYPPPLQNPFDKDKGKGGDGAAQYYSAEAWGEAATPAGARNDGAGQDASDAPAEVSAATNARAAQPPAPARPAGLAAAGPGQALLPGQRPAPSSRLSSTNAAAVFQSDDRLLVKDAAAPLTVGSSRASETSGRRR